MRLTRARIARCSSRVMRDLEAQVHDPESRLHAAHRMALRTRAPPRLDLRGRVALLSQVTLIEPCDRCDQWAETDGESTIWLNPDKPFDQYTLYWTLLHEALHGLMLRADGSCLTEYAEHRMMQWLNPQLV